MSEAAKISIEIIEKQLEEKIKSLEIALSDTTNLEKSSESAPHATVNSPTAELESTINEKITEAEIVKGNINITNNVSAVHKSDNRKRDGRKQKNKKRVHIESQVTESYKATGNKWTFGGSQVENFDSKEEKNMKIQNDKQKAKTESYINSLLKSDSMSTDDKLKCICKNYYQLVDENCNLRLAASMVKLTERQYAKLCREKDALQAKHNRLILSKNLLEGLCRELQKQNKQIKDKSLAKIKEMNEKNKSLIQHFQKNLAETSELFLQYQNSHTEVRKANTATAEKLDQLKDHYEKWGSNMTNILNEKELLIKLSEAKLAKMGLQMNTEKEQHLAERKELLELISQLQAGLKSSHNSEARIKDELARYAEKYTEFQKLLNKSNGTFNNFKSKISKMTKQIEELEKETSKWKKKCLEADIALSTSVKEVTASRAKIKTLETLCRALQDERNKLSSELAGYQKFGSDASTKIRSTTDEEI